MDFILQETQGNDVLYVWTHLNLREDGGEGGPTYNMTYNLGWLLSVSNNN